MCKSHDCVKDASIFSSYACISQRVKKQLSCLLKQPVTFSYSPPPHPNTHRIFHSSVLTSLNAFICRGM